MDPLRPGGALTAQVVVQLEQRPALQDVAGRDPALRQPALGQQRPQVPRVGLIGLGVPLAAAGERGVGRLDQVRRDAGRGQLLGHIPPARAPLQRERDVLTAGEPRQPGPQVHPVGRGDLAAAYLPGHGVEIVESDLLPVDIQPAYDGHRDLLTLLRAPMRPHANGLRINRDASELGRSRRETATEPAHTLTPGSRCMSSNWSAIGSLWRSPDAVPNRVICAQPYA